MTLTFFHNSNVICGRRERELVGRAIRQKARINREKRDGSNLSKWFHFPPPTAFGKDYRLN